jgi:hypothetical protein
MKNLPFLFLLLIATGTAHAQILNQRNVTIGGDSEFIERTVQIPDAAGNQVVVRQILRSRDDGSLTYIPSLQPEETRTYHRALCDATGGEPLTGESTWTAETLMGFGCDVKEDKSSWPQAIQNGVWLQSPDDGREPDQMQMQQGSRGALILEAYAPKNFAVSAGQNTLFSGRGQAVTDTAGYIGSRLQVGDGCATVSQDWIGAHTHRTVQLFILCFATGHVPTINTSMTSCLLGRCASDTGQVTVL